MRQQAANLLSMLRVALAPLLVWSICAGDAAVWSWLGLPIFALAATADVADGWVARRLELKSAVGRWLDHGADIVFLLSGFAAFAWRGVVPWWVPLSIATAFAVYVGDSLRRGGRGALVGSRLGHCGGVLNYVLLGALLVATQPNAAAAAALPLNVLVWSVPIYSGAAIFERLRGASSRPRESRRA